jgi:hypothetical protein
LPRNFGFGEIGLSRLLITNSTTSPVQITTATEYEAGVPGGNRKYVAYFQLCPHESRAGRPRSELLMSPRNFKLAGKMAESFPSMARASQVGQAVLSCPPALNLGPLLE